MILCGFKMCGKSFFAKLLAERLNRPLLDTDSLLEKLYLKEEEKSLSCREIFQQRGETFFRQMEKRVIASIKKEQGLIIAIGGGSLLDPENVVSLKKLGKLIFLQADKETIFKRISHSGFPAFLDKNDPVGSFERIFSQREKIYKQTSDHTLVLQGKKEDEILKCLMELSYGQ